MKTRKFDKSFAEANAPRQLTEEEAVAVNGGIAPLVTVALGAALGAAQSAGAAHAKGGNVLGAAVSGAVQGALAGASGAVWAFSKVASVTLAGVSAAVGTSTAYAVSLFPDRMVEHL